MNKYKIYAKLRYLLLLTVAFAAGCASNPTEITVIPDTIAPTVSVTSPTNTEVAVPVNRKVSVAFSEAMDQASITTSSFSMKETASGADVSGTVTPVGTSATFAPGGDLKLGTKYTVTITGGFFSGVKDLVGNKMASDFVFTFTTATIAALDNTPPTVSLTSPTDTAAAVPVNRILHVGFSEVMDPATIGISSFSLKETVSGANVPGTVTAVGTSAIFAPSADLKLSTEYSATIKGGAVAGVTDLAGNAMASDFVYTFKTATVAAALDLTPPTVTVTSPADTDPAVPVNRIVQIAFSEEMNPATISTASIAMKKTSSGSNVPGTVTRAGTSATFTPTTILDTSTKYTVTVKGANLVGIKDLAGNAMVTDYVFSFTTSSTSDTTAPTLIITGALDGATGLPINRPSTATFSEPMDPATLATPALTFTVKETLSGASVAGVVTYLGNIATFKPNSDLKPLTKYTSAVSNGAKDLAGNALIAGLIPNPWSWTTAAAADITAPKVTVTNPVNGAINIAVDKKMNATFDKAMNPATMTPANITMKETVSGNNVPGTVAYDPQNNIATYSPLDKLAPDTSYTVTVSNAAKDVSGNSLVVPAVDGLNPWKFTTAAATIVPPPALAINLRSAASFGIASRAGLTSTGVTVVNGDIALYPTATCTDSTGNDGASQSCLVKVYSSPTGMAVNGSIYWAGDPFDNGVTANSITNDLNSAWVEARSKVDTFAPGSIAGEQLAGKTLIPGVYHEADLGLSAGGLVILDAQNDPNAVFIFKIDSTFVDSGTLLLPSEVRLINGAQARNVWFVSGLDITIGSGTTWKGNILAGQTATILDGSTVLGRVLAGAGGAGAITITGAASPSRTTISVP